MQNVRDLIVSYINDILGENYDMPQICLCLMLTISFIIHIIFWKRSLDNRAESREVMQTIGKLEKRIQNLGGNREMTNKANNLELKNNHLQDMIGSMIAALTTKIESIQEDIIRLAETNPFHV